MYADAQFNECVNAVAMVTTEGNLPQSPFAGTRPKPGKFCAWFSTGVSGVIPASSMASQYKNGLIEEPTWRLVSIFTWSNLKFLKSMPPTQAFTSPVIGSITINDVCSICWWYLMES